MNTKATNRSADGNASPPPLLNFVARCPLCGKTRTGYRDELRTRLREHLAREHGRADVEPWHLDEWVRHPATAAALKRNRGGDAAPTKP